MPEQITSLTDRQIAQLRELRDLWSCYGAALRAKAALAGGMTWKRVGGAEYLCTYWQDAGTGKKRWTSHGPRSADTEDRYRRYMDARSAARNMIAKSGDEIALMGKLAKTLGLARMPAPLAATVRAFWLAALDERLLLVGGTALYAYELAAEVLVPAALAREDGLTFLLRDEAGIDDAFAAEMTGAYAEAGAEAPAARRQDDGLSLTAAGMPSVSIVPRQRLLDEIERARTAAEDDWTAERLERRAGALREGFDLPALAGVAVAKDSKPVEIRAPDPRAYAQIERVLAGHELAGAAEAPRAAYAVALVKERWPEKFDDADAAAFEGLGEDPDDDMGAPPRI
jgi:hypothetical protein